MKRSLIAMAAISSLMLCGAANAASYTVDKEAPVGVDKSNIELSVGFTNVGIDTVGYDADISAVAVGFGYEFKTSSSNISFVPEIYIGKGVTEEDFVGSTEIELEHFIQLGVRLTLNPTDKFYTFIRPTLTRAQFAVNDVPSGVKVLADETDWELGVGVGAGMYFTKQFSATLSYDRVTSDTDNISLTARYHF